MKQVRLGDVCTVVGGSTPKSNIPEYWNGDIKWITPAELASDSYFIYDTERHITDIAVKKTNLNLLPVGTVLLSCRAPIGKTAIVGSEMYCNQGFKNLVCSDNICNKYLYFFLKSKKNYLDALGRGATFKEISKSIVEDVKIPLPPMEEQHKIACTFEILQSDMEMLKRLADKLDTLVKSRFIEMFGDPVTNPMGWEVEGLGKVCDVRDGTHDSPAYCDEGFPLVTSKNVSSGKIDLSDCSYIAKDDYEKINQRSKVDKGDIIMPMIGTVGIPVIVNFEPNFAIKNVALIKFNSSSAVNNVYIKVLLESNYFDNAIMRKVRGGTQKFISLGDIRKLQVLVPPIALQNQFAAFVQQVDKSKSILQKLLEKQELLRAALMQEYFG